MKRCLMIAALAVLSSGCSLMLANGMFEYSNPSFGGLSLESHTADGETHRVFSTGGGRAESVLDGSVRAWAIRRIKSGESIDIVARAMGIEAQLLREWIK